MGTEKVLVAMSGGVDSSVAAKLLTDAGFSCIGCTMKLYDNEDAGIPKANTCCSLDDVEDARSVAYRLGMPYYVFNLKDKFAACVIDRFVEKYMEGCDVVYGVRNKRETDTFFKRTTAEGFYKFMKILGVDVVFNHADYRLMSRRALEGLSEYKEVNLFLRGIVPLIGFKSDYVYYDRAERFAGESKYPLKKMISFALDGITSFSVKPLKLISNLGILISVLSIFGLLYALISHLCGVTVAGWTAIVASIWLLGGLQMLCLGVVGGYIGKIYSEVKQRPRFLIETHLKAEPEEKVLDEH